APPVFRAVVLRAAVVFLAALVLRAVVVFFVAVVLRAAVVFFAPVVPRVDAAFLAGRRADAAAGGPPRRRSIRLRIIPRPWPTSPWRWMLAPRERAPARAPNRLRRQRAPPNFPPLRASRCDRGCGSGSSRRPHRTALARARRARARAATEECR